MDNQLGFCGRKTMGKVRAICGLAKVGQKNKALIGALRDKILLVIN
jgi:hypothetical protein